MARSMRTRVGVLVATLLVGWAAVLPAPAGAVPSSADGQDVGQAVDGERDAQERVASEPSQDPLQLSLLSATGVRAASSTVLVGAVLNRSDRGRTVTVRLDDLPSDVQLLRVLPSAVEPERGRAWACEDRACELVDQDGSAAQLPAGEGVGLQLVLTGSALTPGGGFQASVDGGASVRVAFDRPDGAPALPDRAITVASVGPRTQSPGERTTTTVTVGNVSEQPVGAGTLVLRWSGTPAGVTSTGAGEGWTCVQPGTCTYAPDVPALGQAAALVLSNDTAPDAVDVTSTVVVDAAAQVAGSAVQATSSEEWRVRPLVASGLSARLELSDTSVSPPATTTATLFATPTGQGPLTDPATLSLELPDGVSADWSAVRTEGPWTCDAATDGCRSTGPVTAGTASVLQVPLSVARGTAADLVHVRLRTEVSGATGADADDEASAGLVINPPPVPELRASMSSALPADGISSVPALGTPIEFPVGVERPVTVRVVNVGSRSAAAGSEVRVRLHPDVLQRVERAGGEGWRCGDRPRFGPRSPLDCTLVLERDLASEDAVELPLVLAASEQGASTWTVNAGVDGTGPKDAARRFVVQVGPSAPQLLTRVSVLDELVRDDVGRLRVVLDNQGEAVARGGVLVVDLPDGVQTADVSGDGWTCADATLRSGRGSLSCAVQGDIEPSAQSTPLVLELVATTGRDRVEVWFWSTSPGQPHTGGRDGGTSVGLDVLPEGRVVAGDDLTVTTPVRGADGVERPAVVQLQGSVPSRLEASVRWQQLCTSTDAERAEVDDECSGSTPAVQWLGVTEGQDPTTERAAFVAPDIDAPVTLRFRLSAGAGARTRSDDVTVRLVPARVTAVAGSTADADVDVERGTGGTGAAGTQPTTAPATPGGGAADEVAVTVGDGSTLQVPTRTSAVLSAGASGVAPISYRWTQTDGPSATVLGGTGAAQLSFTAPDLEPDEDGAELTFSVTATDALGNSAEATAEVQVVWGDDGLQVELADGAASVVATVGTPVVVTSDVASAGAPYEYEWSIAGDLELPSGTTTDGPVLSFTAPNAPATGTATLQVTDSFGRVTRASVDLSVTRLPAGVVPVAMCTALSSLSAGTDAALSGAQGGVTAALPAAGAVVSGDTTPTTSSSTTTPATSSTTTTAAPTSSTTTTAAPTSSTTTTAAPTSSTTTSSTTTSSTTTSSTTTSSTTTSVPGGACPATATATFLGATVTLPGGVVVSGASGELSIAGVTVSSGTVSLPTSWGAVVVELPEEGLLLPFVSSTEIDVPTGVLQGSDAPFLSLPGWTFSTQLAFRSDGLPRTVVQSTGAPATGSGSIDLRGNASGAGDTSLAMTATGLVGIGAADVPVSGTVDAAATGAPTFDVSGSIGATPLATDVTLARASLGWTPQGSTGTAQLALGTAPMPLLLSAAVSIDGSGTRLDLSTPSPWSPAGASGPTLQLTGSGSLEGERLQLSLAAPALAPWQLTRSVLVSELSGTATADCTLSTDTACGPSVELSGTVDLRPLADAPIAVRGQLDVVSGTTQLQGGPATLRVAPLVVTDATTTITLDPTSGATAQAAGTSQVLGADRSTAVDLGAGAAVAVAQLGDRQLVSGWTLDDTVALAADAATSYDLDDAGSAAAVPLTPGELVGAAVTSLPSDLADGVLPTQWRSGVVTFPIDGAPTTTYRLTAQGDPWDVLGAPGDEVAATVQPLTFLIASDGSTASVQVQGSGSFSMAAVGDAPAAAPIELLVTGTLTSDKGDGVLDLQLSTASWNDAFGLSGLALSQLALALQVTPGSTSATLQAAAQLPVPLADALGAGPGPFALTGTMSADAPCAQVDLTPIDGVPVDPGGSGLLSTSDAQLVLSPTGCTPLGADDQVPAGAQLLLGGAALGTHVLEVDPVSSVLSGQVDLGAATVGGVPLADTTVTVDTSAATPYELSATLLLDDGPEQADLSVQVSGPLQPGAGPGQPGSVQLATTSAQQLELAATSVTLDELSLTATAQLVAAGSATISATASLAVLGEPVSTTVTGTVANGSVGALHGMIASATYALVDGDTLQTPFTLTLGPPAGGSGWTAQLASSSNGVLTVDGFEFSDATITLTPSGFGLSGTTPLPGSPELPVHVSGAYTLDDGAVDLATAASVDLSLAGFAVSGSATFVRSGGTFTPTMRASMPLGIFDDDTPFEVSGTLKAPTGPGSAPTVEMTTADDVSAQLRALRGTASLVVAPPSSDGSTLAAQLAGAGWYDATLTFVTDPGDCDLWSGSATFEGDVYRSGGTSYYSLAADVVPGLAADLIPGAPASAGPQPSVLSNELPNGDQPAPGPTYQLGLQGPVFTALGMWAASVATCSYTIGATAMLSFQKGEVADALSQALDGAQPTIDANVLFGSGGSLPESIWLVRSELQANEIAAELGAQQAALAQISRQAQAAVAQAQDDAATARQSLQDAQQELDHAAQEWNQAMDRLSSAQNAQESAAAREDVSGAQGALQAAADQVDSARQQVAQAADRVSAAVPQLGAAQAREQQAQELVGGATEDAEQAQQALAEAEQAAQEQQAQEHASQTAVLSLQFTHCDTCEVTDDAELSGELYFLVHWLVGIDLDFAWDATGLQSFTGSFTVGWLEQMTAGWSHLYLYAAVEAEVTANFGWNDTNGWDNLSLVFQGSAQIDAYLSLWIATLSATLVDIEVTGTLTILPWPPTFSASLDVDVFGYDYQTMLTGEAS
jgi:hypothetical protein